MNMIDALQFAAHQQQQQSAREHARRAAQEGAEALAAVRAQMLVREREQAASAVPADSSSSTNGGLDAANRGIKSSAAGSTTEKLSDIRQLPASRVPAWVNAGDREAARPMPDSAHSMNHAQARVQAPAPARAGLSGHSREPNANANHSQLADTLLRSWENDIQQMAVAASAMPSKGVGRLIREGVRARGHRGREAVLLEKLVWARRQELVATRKAAREAALGIIEAGLTG